uniref:Uncharacterized protein n=1 Tax=Panagrolaimus sp. ES5 TaxID=591445 RepID=A0AC34FUS5_9BILA
MVREELINEIIKHAEGSIKKQKEACEVLRVFKIPSEPTYIPKLLPLFIKFMESE